jgi:uncharacterized protein
MSDEPGNLSITSQVKAPEANREEEWDGAVLSEPAAKDASEPLTEEPGDAGFVVHTEAGMDAPLPFRRLHGRSMEWPSVRMPNFADAGIFFMMLVLGFLVAGAGVGIALYFHSFGLRSFDDIQNSTALALVTQVCIYLIGLLAAIPFFRIVWGKGFFDGIHWHAGTARRLVIRLILAAVFCNAIAMVGNLLLPFPQHAPIDKLFGKTSDAWLLMAFGVTIAPFFEEMIFRGFLVPALATAWDWLNESITGKAPLMLDAEGNPQWSMAAMVIAALVASVPFTLMHAAQVGKAWGPLLLLYCVSLILCAVRLMTRSLAASTLVHSLYNLMLFAMMLWQTGGFRHMDKM